jgi:hypothetical protein
MSARPSGKSVDARLFRMITRATSAALAIPRLSQETGGRDAPVKAARPEGPDVNQDLPWTRRWPDPTGEGPASMPMTS